MTRDAVRLGTGIYLRSDAARLIGVAPSRLRRWVEGYTYRSVASPRVGSRRQRPPVVKRDLPIVDSAIALSFVELMELRVVKALLDHDMSLQAVRAAASVASAYFGTEHPLASRRVYTDGKKAFAALRGDERDVPDLVELTRHRVQQIIAGKVFQPFLDEIDFNPSTSLAERWWPEGKDVPIVLDPRIAFGAPIVVGTGIRTSTLARMAEEDGTDTAANAFQLGVAEVLAARDFELRLRAA
jgi:uncharacterized protein (DUF433 family)